MSAEELRRSSAPLTPLCCVLSFFPSFQSLQNKSYNHFAAIYYLLVERLKAHRCSFPVEQRLDARQRRPSTIAEQTVVKVSVGGGGLVVSVKTNE